MDTLSPQSIQQKIEVSKEFLLLDVSSKEEEYFMKITASSETEEVRSLFRIMFFLLSFSFLAFCILLDHGSLLFHTVGTSKKGKHDQNREREREERDILLALPLSLFLYPSSAPRVWNSCFAH